MIREAQKKSLFIRNLDVHLCGSSILHMSASFKLVGFSALYVAREQLVACKKCVKYYTYYSQKAPAGSTKVGSSHRRDVSRTGGQSESPSH